MKLLAKTSLIYLLSTTLVFLVGGLIFYSNLRRIVDEETTENITAQKQHFENFVRKNDSIPALSYESNTADFMRETKMPVKAAFSDTSFFSPDENEDLPYRMLTFPVKAKGKNYAVRISKPLFESDDLVEAILYSFISILAVLLLVVLISNRIAAGKLWKPFFSTVNQLQEYNIGRHVPLQPSPTSTSEFRTLNAALQKMTEKMAADYKKSESLYRKCFARITNAAFSHHDSTEQLLQEKNFDPKTIETIQSIHQTARKLSRLNKALLLLAKIENRQFEKREALDWGEMLEAKTELYADIIAHKEIRLEKNIPRGFVFSMHPMLAETIISNLLMNAIRHNHKGGTISVSLDKEKLRICNSGAPLHSEKQLFERFYKENPSSESSGLGLALVKQIAETNGMKIQYSYAEGQHCFEVLFEQN